MVVDCQTHLHLLLLFLVDDCKTLRGLMAPSVCVVHWVVVAPTLAYLLLLLLIHLLHSFLAEHCGTPRGPKALPVIAVHMAVTAVGVLQLPA